MDINNIVSIDLRAAATAPAGQNFNNVLLITNGSQFTTSEVRTYNNFNELSDDFASSTFAYRAGQAFFSQSPRPPQLKVGLLPAPINAFRYSVSLASVTALTSSLAVVTPAGVTHSLTQPWVTSANVTALALSAQINSITGISSSVTTGVITATATDEADQFYFDTSTPLLDITETTLDNDYGDALTALANIDNNFYGVIIDSVSAENIADTATAAAALNKKFFSAPQATVATTWTSALFTSTAQYNALRTNASVAYMLTKASRLYPLDAAWAANGLGSDPGTATWAFKRLAGQPYDAWTGTEITHIDSVGGNYNVNIAAVNTTFPGKMSSGDYIDAEVSKDWLRDRLQIRLLALLNNNKKVPFTDRGIAMCLAEVKSVLNEAQNRDLIDRGWSVAPLTTANVDPIDRAARVLRGITFECVLAGAVHQIAIQGSIALA